MKALKHFLIVGTLCAFLTSVHAQTVPPIKQRTDSGYQQVDDYLIAPKRLGIPTGTSDNLNATVAPANTVKLLYRSDLEKLRIYNPVTGLWRDATPVEGFIKANPTESQAASFDITGSGYVRDNFNVDGTTNLKDLNSEAHTVSGAWGGYSDQGFSVVNRNFGYGKAQINLSTGSQAAKLYLSGENYEPSSGSDNTLYLDLNGINILKFKGSAAFLVAPPVASASGFELLSRDKTTGEIKKIELADLKAMLNNIQ